MIIFPEWFEFKEEGDKTDLKILADWFEDEDNIKIADRIRKELVTYKKYPFKQKPLLGTKYGIFSNILFMWKDSKEYLDTPWRVNIIYKEVLEEEEDYSNKVNACWCESGQLYFKFYSNAIKFYLIHT